MVRSAMLVMECNRFVALPVDTVYHDSQRCPELTNQITPWSEVLPEKLIFTQSRNSPPYMEPEKSLPYSQGSVYFSLS
jgi:hypothetical protein